ncbi:MAG: hypothetical protein JRI65_13770 [Deltaproteobacteria bacterium]|nr:hypothetical protein [Deltaproteobacteria bacterium]
MNLENVASIAMVVSVLISTVALFYTAHQVKQHKNISCAQFWLELEKMFAQHDEVHVKLRPGGEWTGNGGPKTGDEWAKVEDYMGLFEHCELMLRKELIDWETFQTIFSYRLRNVVANKTIVEAKLKKERPYWEAFVRLLKRLNIEIPA